MGIAFPPLNVTARYRPDGALRAAITNDIAGAASAATNAASKELSALGGQAAQLINNALATTRNSTGALDIGGTSGKLREQAAADQRRAGALRELATATASLAREQGQLDSVTDRTVASLRQEAVALDQSAASALSHAGAVERLQGALNRQAGASGAVVAATRREAAANDNATASAASRRAGLQQFGFQLSDIATQFSLGARPAQIFAAQAGQVSQALALMGGKGALGAVGKFLGGPWGIALTVATVALSPFIGRLFEAKGAADEVKLATYGLSDAQSILGGVLDITTGKIENQSVALIALARSKAVLEQITARTNIRKATDDLRDEAQIRPLISGRLSMMAPSLQFGRGVTAPGGDIASAVLDGSLRTDEAERSLKSFLATGRITEEQYIKTAKAVTDLGVAQANLKLFEGTERLLTGQGTAADRALLLKPKNAPKGRTSRGDGGAAAREEFGEDTATKIANIADQFSRIPPAVQQANKATRQLDDVIDDIARRKPLNFEKLIADANTAKGLITENLGRPFRDALEAESRSIEVQRLRAQGREAEADVLAYQYDLATKIGAEDREGIEAALAKLGISKSEYAQGIANLGVQRQLTREAQRAATQQQRQLGFIADTRSNLVQAAASLRTEGVGAVGGFFNRAIDQFNAAAAEHLVDKLFGSAFQNAEDQVTQAHRLLAQSSLTAAKALNNLAGAAGTDGDPAGSEIANEIVVLGKKIEDFNNPRDLVRLIGREIAKAGGLSDADAARLGKAIGSGFQGAAIGSVTSGILKSVGIKSSTTGAQVGGAIGQVAFGPIGGIVGSIAGGLIGGLFKKTKSGSATLGFGADGLGITGTGGNSKSQRDAASSAAGSIGDSLNRIAEELGGSADGPVSVSIGLRNKSYRVDTSGSGKTKGAGVLDFGQDQAAALKAAIADAIRDGVITGISAGAQRLLKGGSDVDKQLAKALSFEGALSRARALSDPVGVALDTLDKEFGRLKKIFGEAGASAGEYASLEKLYGSERAKAAKEATESIAGSLRSLYSDLTVNNDALSLRDRKAFAQAKYDPLAARVAGGDVTAFEEFSDAARALLEIERQFSGSQTGYFDLQSRVTSLSKARLDELDAMAAASTGRDSPFTNSGVPVDSSANVVSAVQQQTADLIDGLLPTLQAVNDNIGAMLIRTGTMAQPQLTERGYF